MLEAADPEIRISGIDDEEDKEIELTNIGENDNLIDNEYRNDNVNNNNNNRINTKEQMAEHEIILEESKKTVLFFIVCALFTSFLRSSRTNVWILYARIFYLETSTNIAWVLYGGTMFSGVSALFYSSVADYIGYDKMMVIVLGLKCIGVLLECIGIDFSLLIIGYLLTALAILYVCLSYISWILPHKYAVTYTSYFYAAYFLSYLSGAMIGSILSYYFNYRLIFWVNFGFMAAIFVFSIYFILGIQIKLEKKQLKFKKLYKIIPVKLNQHQHQQNTFENRNHDDYQLVSPIEEEEEEEEEEKEEEEEYIYDIDEDCVKLTDINERF
eukprot:342366_1